MLISILQLLGLGHLAITASAAIAIAGLAFTTGLSSVISDVMGGVFLAKDHDFRLGDHISVPEIDTEGVVETMDMRRVRVRDQGGPLFGHAMYAPPRRHPPHTWVRSGSTSGCQ